MSVRFLPRRKTIIMACLSYLAMNLFNWYLIYQVEFCEAGGKDLMALASLYKYRWRKSYNVEVFNSLAFLNIKYSYPIASIVFILS